MWPKFTVDLFDFDVSIIFSIIVSIIVSRNRNRSRSRREDEYLQDAGNIYAIHCNK